MKQFIATILAAQIMLTSATAKTELPQMTAKQEQQMCKAFIGVDDAVMLSLFAWIVITVFQKHAAKWERDELKEKLKQKCS